MKRRQFAKRLFAFVGVASLLLTQLSYYYFRGAASVYADYEKVIPDCAPAPPLTVPCPAKAPAC